jgi:predicted PurR-regulated permease PerM
MKKLARNIAILAVVAAILFALWYFKNIVGYVLMALVLSFVGKPILRGLSRLRIRRFALPQTLCAALTILILWSIFLGIFRVFIPLVAEQFNVFSSIDFAHLMTTFDQNFQRFSDTLHRYVPAASGFSLKDTAAQELERIFSNHYVTSLVASLAGTLKNLVVAAFAVTFITFFFLRDDGMFFKFIILLVPKRYEVQITRALSSVNQLLVRYFVGIFCDMLCMLTLLSLGLTLIAGFPLPQAMLIGLTAGILNVIPYVGPLVGLSVSMLFALTMSLHSGAAFALIAAKTAAVFLVAQALDMALLQPYIYSNSIKSHPLEIFIVILAAGSIGGILGMLVAIPTYTILRVFAKEFLNNMRVVQKLTEKI